jgi:hypothetical protein
MSSAGGATTGATAVTAGEGDGGSIVDDVGDTVESFRAAAVADGKIGAASPGVADATGAGGRTSGVVNAAGTAIAAGVSAACGAGSIEGARTGAVVGAAAAGGFVVCDGGTLGGVTMPRVETGTMPARERGSRASGRLVVGSTGVETSGAGAACARRAAMSRWTISMLTMPLP